MVPISQFDYHSQPNRISGKLAWEISWILLSKIILLNITDDVSPLLQDLLKETEDITERSRWSIGKVEGKLMQFLVKDIGYPQCR